MENKNEYFREAVRLSELLLAEQQRSIAINQNKAVLLITFCISAFGYLYAAADADAWKECLPPRDWFAGNIVLALAFLAAIGCGIMVLNTEVWWVQGVAKDYSLHEFFAENFDKRACALLDTYYENFLKNEEILSKKSKYLLASKILGLLAIFCVFIIVVSAKADALEHVPLLADMCVYPPSKD